MLDWVRLVSVRLHYFNVRFIRFGYVLLFFIWLYHFTFISCDFTFVCDGCVLDCCIHHPFDDAANTFQLR